MKLTIGIVCAVVCLLTSCRSTTFSLNQLRDCDLLFVVSPTDNAITDVTQGIDGTKIDHVAIFFRQKTDNGKQTENVIEAIGKGVVVTPIDTFLSLNSNIIVGRVKKKIDKKQTLSNAKTYLNRNYDYLYLPDNEAIYCSELVQLSFIDRHGEHIFSTIPMTFRNEKGEISQYWQNLYKSHNMDVPEGKEGTNPGELSRRKIVKTKILTINK